MPKPAKWEEEFDKLMTPPKYLPEQEGTDCLMCGWPMPNARGTEMLKEFIHSLLDAERKRLREAVAGVPLILDRDGAHNCIVRTEALAAFDRVAGEVV